MADFCPQGLGTKRGRDGIPPPSHLGAASADGISIHGQESFGSVTGSDRRVSAPPGRFLWITARGSSFYSRPLPIVLRLRRLIAWTASPLRALTSNSIPT